MIGRRPILIEIDGGVTPETAPLLSAAGADVLVAGSAIFRGGETNYRANIAAIRMGAATAPKWNLIARQRQPASGGGTALEGCAAR